MHVHHMHHSSRARVTVLSLKTSLSLTRNMNVKVAKELYYIFSDTVNFSLTLSTCSFKTVHEILVLIAYGL